MTEIEQILQSLYDRVIEPSEALEQLEKAQEADKQLAEIKVEEKSCKNCRWSKKVYVHCVWCLRDEMYNNDFPLETINGYIDNWEPIK
jgi:hypothetical protein